MHSEALPPILCAHLLRRVDGKLINLLSSLTAAEWDLQTIASQWRVRDVAAHLLDTPLRKLSMVRDSWFVDAVRVSLPQEVVALVDRLNREGVIVYRRLSPQILIHLMKEACEQSARFHESLDPFAPAVFNVSWAGEEQSPNWFDTSRELTERWHHQQQIRLATSRPSLLERELYHPVLDCFMRGLPYLYRDVEAPGETLVVVQVSGECGGQWFLSKDLQGWQLLKRGGTEFASKITIPQDLAWRLFTKGVDRESARSEIQIEGDRDLGERTLELTAIVG